MPRSVAANHQEDQQLATIDDAADEANEEGEVHGVAAMDTAEQLTNQDVQQFALGLCLAGLPLVLWAQSVPMSCVYLEQSQVDWPSKQCTDIAGRSQLRLQDFCMKSCMKGQAQGFFVAFLFFALALQASVVIMNHGKCANFLRLSFSVDFQKQTEDLQRALDDAEREDISSSSWWKSVKKYSKQAFLNVLMSTREAFSKSSTRRFLLAPRVLIRFSQMHLVGALGMIGMLVANNLSLYPILLECGDEVLRLHYQHSWYHLSGHGVACLILIAVVLLQSTAKFTVQLRFIKDDRTIGDADISKLKAQFKKCKDGLFLKKNLTLDKNLTHFQRRLEKNYLRQLESVEHDGYIDNPDRALNCHSWKGPVTLHFKLRKPLVWPFAENWHRVAAITSCFWTALCLFGSSQLCWLCVHSIKTNKHISDFQMQIYLSMMGACGRHSPIGIGSFLGAILLFVAFIMQIVLWKFTDPQAIGSNTSGCYSACLKAVRDKYPHEFASQQLWVGIFSATLSDVILDMGVYEKAEVKQEDIPEIWCYVWVTLTPSTAGQEEEEEIQNVDASAGPTTRGQQGNDRTQWRKSKQPRKVKLETPPDNNLEEWLAGLVRDEYGIPVLPVTVLDKGNPKEKQIIPLQFVGGGPSVWLNLGRKHSWDKLSGAFAFSAFVIVLGEILFSFFYSYARMLSSCDDVLNTQCMYYTINAKQEHPVTFRRSLGAWTAMVGCVLSLFSCMCIRVANQADAGKVSCSGCVCAYVRAVGFILFKVWDAVHFLVKSSFDHTDAICRKTCCPVKQRAVTEDGSDVELLADGTYSEAST